MAKKENKVNIYTDGASRGNPGEASIAYSIEDQNGKVLAKGQKRVGVMTNNEAEYLAIITALDEATKFTENEVQVNSDSNLAVNQLNGNWKIKAGHIRELVESVKKHEEEFKKVSYTHQSREHPKIADCDKRANMALDGTI